MILISLVGLRFAFDRGLFSGGFCFLFAFHWSLLVGGVDLTLFACSLFFGGINLTLFAWTLDLGPDLPCAAPTILGLPVIVDVKDVLESLLTDATFQEHDQNGPQREKPSNNSKRKAR